MFSRILTKLIDEAIVPAVLLIAAKLIGVVFAVKYFDINISPGSSFLNLYFTSQNDFIKVNSYSALFMCLVVGFGAFVFLVKSRYFHDTHVSPTSAARLFHFGVGKFIQTSFDIYSEGTVWLSYSFLMTALLLSELYFGMIYSWVFLISLTVAVFLLLILISDVEREVKVARA